MFVFICHTVVIKKFPYYFFSGCELLKCIACGREAAEKIKYYGKVVKFRTWKVCVCPLRRQEQL